MEERKCPYCDGLGRFTCTSCEGKGGKIVNNFLFMSMIGCFIPEYKVCNICNGTGIYTCKHCNGTGRL